MSANGFATIASPLPLHAYSSSHFDTGAATSSLKRQASVRKMLTLAKRKTFMVNFKLQLDSLFDSMRRTRCTFLYCLVPTESAQQQQQQEPLLDIPLVRSQLKAYQILAACRIYRQGYPDSLSFVEFCRGFSICAASNTNNPTMNTTLTAYVILLMVFGK